MISGNMRVMQTSPHGCVGGQIMQNESATDFEIVACPDCKLDEKMKELFPDTEYDRAERARYYSQRDN